mgnify:CR=1 FL=1
MGAFAERSHDKTPFRRLHTVIVSEPKLTPEQLAELGDEKPIPLLAKPVDYVEIWNDKGTRVYLLRTLFCVKYCIFTL